jgi:hypothetical protein
MVEEIHFLFRARESPARHARSSITGEDMNVSGGVVTW